MQTLYISLKLLEADKVELRYWQDRPSAYERQVLPLSDIQDLIKQGELDYYVLRPDLKPIGQHLFVWLDGTGRWLSRAINDCRVEGLVLAIAAEARLSYLPWEVLHDGTGFLVERVAPLVVPVRWVNSPTDKQSVQTRPLQILFMATSPDGVEPVLDFEQEEASLLKVTQGLPLTLRVEESGCAAELNKRWERYKEGTFDVFHLTGHAAVQSDPPYAPFFITETDMGARQDTSAHDLFQVFQVRRPPLIFLSGCCTGQAGNQGSVPSMAETLVQQGLSAVLGWGRPVTDPAATAAAAHLYEKLAAGYDLSQALGLTHRYLLQQLKVKDWHLLRLYARNDAWGALVEAPGDYQPPPEPIQFQFLDLDHKVRVASPEAFVGRRRTIQRCLRQWRTAESLGVLLHGLGGVGKSTTAARILERLPDYQSIVIYRALDAPGLERLLAAQCTSVTGHDILQSRLPLMQRLTQFLSQGLNESGQKLVFVLDDFEANLEPIATGVQVLKPAVVEVVMALLEAIARSHKAHRVLITSRYDFSLPELNHRLYRESLAALRGADLLKKCDRLPAFGAQSGVEAGLQQQAKTIADGNPRLLEWLDKILNDPQLDQATILEHMAARATEFRAAILAAELLKQQPPALQAVLAIALVFELPVPYAAIAAVCPSIDVLKQHCERAVALGLLEVSQSQAGPNYRVPRILVPLLPDEINPTLQAVAATVLYRLWWTEAETSTEDQCLELHRLALQANSAAIAGVIGAALTNRWNRQNRYREVVVLSKTTLTIAPEAILYYNLAEAEVTLGDVDVALEHYQQSLTLSEGIGDVRGKAATLHQMAVVYAQQGDVTQALTLYQQSLTLSEGIGDVRGKAATLHDMAVVYAQQGDVTQALTLYQQSLTLKEGIGDVRGKAATLHQMADIYAQQGDVTQALTLYQQSLTLKEGIGDVRGKAVTLANMAGIYAQQGDVTQALTLYQQSLTLNEAIGDVGGKAVTLANMASLAENAGDKAQALTLNLQAAQALAQSDAYVDLITVLSNLGNTAEDNSLIYLAQSVWLSLRVQSPLESTVQQLAALHQQVPSDDALEALLAATAQYLCAVRGNGHPQLAQVQALSKQMMTHAAKQQGIETQAAYDTWVNEQQLGEPAIFVPKLQQRLEAIVGDQWLLDRSKLQEVQGDR